jgi:hypothetical protein
MIKRISLAKLTSPEYYQFMFLILGIIDKADPKLLKILQERTQFAALVSRLLLALNREQGFALSKILDEIDQRRDDAIIGFALWLKALTLFEDKDLVASASALRAYLKTHGDKIANQNQQKETAILTKIVDDCKNDAVLKSHVTKVKDIGWLPAIERNNNDYITNYQARSTQMGASANEESFTSVRKLMGDSFSSITDLLATRYKAAKADNLPTTLFEKCIDDINATIDQYKTLIVQTKTTKKVETKE